MNLVRSLEDLERTIEEGESEEETHGASDRGEDLDEVEEDVLLDDVLADLAEVEVDLGQVRPRAGESGVPPLCC